MESKQRQCPVVGVIGDGCKVQCCKDQYCIGTWFSSVQSLSCVQLVVTPGTAACQDSLSITNSQSPPKPMSIWVCDTIQPSHPLSSPSPPAPNLSQQQGLFQWVSSSHQEAKILEFQLQHSPSNEHPDWFPLGWTGWISLQSKGLSRVFSNTTVQKASILRHSAFFIIQLSYPYMTTGETIALTRQTFVDKVTSLLFNMLSRLVITLLPRRKHLLNSWLQSPSAVILQPIKIKVCHCFHCFPIYLPWSDGTECHDLSFLNVEL